MERFTLVLVQPSYITNNFVLLNILRSCGAFDLFAVQAGIRSSSSRIETAFLGRGSNSRAWRNQAPVAIGAASGSLATARSISRSVKRLTRDQFVWPRVPLDSGLFVFSFCFAIYQFVPASGFIPGRLSGADNTSFLTSPHVNHRQHGARKLTVRDHSDFLIIESVVLPLKVRSVEDPSGIAKGDAMFGGVGSVLLRIPVEFHQPQYRRLCIQRCSPAWKPIRPVIPAETVPSPAPALPPWCEPCLPVARPRRRSAFR